MWTSIEFRSGPAFIRKSIGVLPLLCFCIHCVHCCPNECVCVFMPHLGTDWLGGRDSSGPGPSVSGDAAVVGATHRHTHIENEYMLINVLKHSHLFHKFKIWHHCRHGQGHTEGSAHLDLKHVYFEAFRHYNFTEVKYLFGLLSLHYTSTLCVQISFFDVTTVMYIRCKLPVVTVFMTFWVSHAATVNDTLIQQGWDFQ